MPGGVGRFFTGEAAGAAATTLCNEAFAVGFGACSSSRLQQLLAWCKFEFVQATTAMQGSNNHAHNV